MKITGEYGITATRRNRKDREREPAVAKTAAGGLARWRRENLMVANQGRLHDSKPFDQSATAALTGSGQPRSR